MSKEGVVEDIGSRIRLLVIALIILAVVLTAYMFVECALLLYSVCKKKTVHRDPDSVVVKSSKKAKESRCKSSKSSGKKRSGKSKSKSSKRTSSKRRRSSKASAPLPLQAKKHVKSAGKIVESAKSKKPQTPAAKSAIPPSNLNIPKFEGIHSDEFSAGTSTEKLNARISPPFETPKTANDLPTDGTSTEQINANVPPQFEAKSRPPVLYPTPEFVREVAEQVARYLEARQTVAAGLPKNNMVAPSETPMRPQQDIRRDIQPAPRGSSKPIVSPHQSTPLADNRSLEQQLASPPNMVTKESTESVFMMDVGSNGEINKVHAPPPKDNPMNSLMLNLETRNAVPVPVEGQKPGAQPGQSGQPENAKGSGTQL